MATTGLNKILEVVRTGRWPRNLFCGMLVFACFVVFTRIHYSDGDDAFFDQMANSMAFLDYLKERYMGWTGRLGCESIIYAVFRWGGIWFWRVANAFAVVLLPLMVVRLTRESLGSTRNDCGFNHLHEIRWALIAMMGYLLMDVMTFGHAAVWVNGSIVYTWCALLATFALTPAVRCVSGDGQVCSSWGKNIVLVVCAVVAALSVEQIGAVLFGLMVAALVAGYKKRGSLDKMLIVQIACVAVALAVSYMSPGNAIRTVAEAERWMPESYLGLSLAGRAFISAQWLLSSFANEGKVFFVMMWALGAITLWFNTRKIDGWILAAGIFAMAALLPFAKIGFLSSLGLEYIDPAVPTTVLPSWAAMTLANKLAFFWWGAALAFTMPFLWKASGKSILLLLVFAAGVASECMMFFSPTIYASGERVYFVTTLLFLFVSLRLMMNLELNIKSEKLSNVIVAVIAILGIVNGISQVSIILSKLG